MSDKPKKPAKVSCEILRDVWDAEGARIRKGEVTELDAETAMDYLEAGIAKRVKK